MSAEPTSAAARNGELGAGDIGDDGAASAFFGANGVDGATAAGTAAAGTAAAAEAAAAGAAATAEAAAGPAAEAAAARAAAAAARPTHRPRAHCGRWPRRTLSDLRL